jgi:hypothetical protein
VTESRRVDVPRDDSRIYQAALAELRKRHRQEFEAIRARLLKEALTGVRVPRLLDRKKFKACTPPCLCERAWDCNGGVPPITKLINR